MMEAASVSTLNETASRTLWWKAEAVPGESSIAQAALVNPEITDRLLVDRLFLGLHDPL